ncbi:MAG TPA: CDP-alcohol phosphatidyltransferase family protein [Kofleriaceae bacterium]|nr:CDP-alcohol phosphatidyltransferase family protein [Kofleriaceae bacterium]
MTALATPPNLATAARVVLIAAAAIAWNAGGRPVALALGVVAGLTDYLDGALARRLGLTSRLGAMLDQFADAFLVLVGLTLAVTTSPGLSPLVLVLVMARELWVQGLRREAAARGLELPSRPLGKWSSFFLGWGLVPLLVGAALELAPSVASTTHLVGALLVYLGTGLGLLAAFAYTRTFALALRREGRAAGDDRPPIGSAAQSSS